MVKNTDGKLHLAWNFVIVLQGYVGRKLFFFIHEVWSNMLEYGVAGAVGQLGNSKRLNQFELHVYYFISSSFYLNKIFAIHIHSIQFSPVLCLRSINH